MGYYIPGPTNGKADHIVEVYKGVVLDSQPKWEEVPEDMALVCVVDNGDFEAAGLCVDEREFNRFAAPDELRNPNPPVGVIDMNPTEQRPRTWVLMPKSKAYELSGVR